MPRRDIEDIKVRSVLKDISDQLKSGAYRSADIAAKHHLSAESVRAIRRAGTVKQWHADKIKRLARRNELLVQRGKKAVHKRYAPTLDQIINNVTGVSNKRVMTPEDMTIQIKDLQRRDDGHDERIDRIIRWVTKIDARTAKRPTFTPTILNSVAIILLAVAVILEAL